MQYTWLKNYIRVIADDFVYKSKHSVYNLASLEPVSCNNKINISGAAMTAPDESWTLHILNANSNVQTYLSNLLNLIHLFIKPFKNLSRLFNFVCFNKPHFPLLIDYDKYCPEFDTWYLICNSKQYSDITDIQHIKQAICKSKMHFS